MRLGEKGRFAIIALLVKAGGFSRMLIKCLKVRTVIYGYEVIFISKNIFWTIEGNPPAYKFLQSPSEVFSKNSRRH